MRTIASATLVVIVTATTNRKTRKEPLWEMKEGNRDCLHSPNDRPLQALG